MDLEAKKAIVRRIRGGLKVTEVFCTRILKGTHGSVLVGLTTTLDHDMPLAEAEIAALLLGQRVDQLAYDRAVSDGVISSRDYEFASNQTKINYNHKIGVRLEKLDAKAEKAPSTDDEDDEILHLEIEDDEPVVADDVVKPIRMGGSKR
jgi:hypothetical protein